MRYASHYLYVSADKVYKQYAVELDGMHASRIVPIIEEIESTIWLGGIIVLSELAEFTIKTNQTFQELIDELCSDIEIVEDKVLSNEVFVYHLALVDLPTLTLLQNSRLQRL